MRNRDYRDRPDEHGNIILTQNIKGHRNLPSVTSTQSRVIEHCSNGYGVGRVKEIISSLGKTAYYVVKSHGKVIYQDVKSTITHFC